MVRWGLWFCKRDCFFLEPALRWYPADLEFDSILEWAAAWDGERNLHMVDAFGASCKMMCLVRLYLFESFWYFLNLFESFWYLSILFESFWIYLILVVSYFEFLICVQFCLTMCKRTNTCLPWFPNVSNFFIFFVSMFNRSVLVFTFFFFYY